MSGRQIRDEVRTLALAGYETLAEALTWAWYLLARSPAAEAELVAEAAGIPGERALVVGDLPRLAHHRMVLAEAMRLYPPSWVFVRVARRSDVLPSGVRVPYATKIYLCPWVTHRDARYCPDPERFDPRRFTPEAVQARPKFTYFPFGGGRRLCIGEEFAWTEGVLLLAAIGRRVRLAIVPGQTIVPDPNVTLRPKHGLRMLLTRR
jgi:cytochrome P450